MKFSYQEFNADKLFSGIDPKTEKVVLTLTDHNGTHYTWVTDALLDYASKLGVDLGISYQDISQAHYPVLADGALEYDTHRDRLPGWSDCSLSAEDLREAIDEALNRTYEITITRF